MWFCLNSSISSVDIKNYINLHVLAFCDEFYLCFQQAELDLENMRKLEEAQATIRMSLRDPKKKDKKQTQASLEQIILGCLCELRVLMVCKTSYSLSIKIR